MPSRSYPWSGKNNRSQHNLVGTTAAEDAGQSGQQPSVPGSAVTNPPSAGGSAAANPPSASPNPTFSSSESFQHDTSNNRSSHQQPPPPPPHLLQHSNSVSGAAFDSRPPREHDYADQVSRSQSQRYPQISPVTTQLHHHHPQQQQHQQQQQQQQQHQQQQQGQQQSQHSPRYSHPFGSGSAEDLSAAGGQSISSPITGPPQPLFSQQQQQPPPAPQKQKSSTRKLVKNIFSRDHAPQVPQNNYNNPPGVNRRNSKRVSLPPPAPPSLRTGLTQVSQVSLDQQQLDWQNQAPPSQPSPLQGVGDFRESYVIDGSDQELHLQNPHDIQQHPTIRPVPPSDSDNSPYSADESAYRQHQGHFQHNGHTPPEQQFGQAIFEPQPNQQLSPHSQQQQQHPHLQQQQQQQQQYHYSSPQQSQYQSGFSGHLANPQQQNPETISQLSHESPVTDSDQRSASNIQAQSSQTSSAVSYPHQAQDIPGRPNPQSAAQGQAPQQQPQSMAPPTGGQPPARRSQEADKGLRDPAQAPPGPPPSYRQSQQPNMNNPLPQPPNAPGANPAFRTSNVPDRQFDGPGDIAGRNSPQPPPSDRGEDPDKAFKDLLTKYKNVKRLYFDGKKEIEQLSGQVEQLQNAIANQRMSQSRTSLDDSEYSTRFNRLNGAINNLSFNIRKDWQSLPQWLVPYVSPEALKTGKHEMTAVGRAVITRWLVEEIFNRCFHPGLEPELSRQLKMIERNIRNFSYTLSSQEEYDALTSKVVSWRMATLEGLQDALRSGEAVNYKADFTRRATTDLTASLFHHLSNPPPPGVDGSASMIVELAVGIAANLPLESRDVAITYPLPESPIQPDIMEVVEKQGLPALEARPAEGDDEGAGDEKEGGGKDKDARRNDKSRAGMLSVLGGGGSTPGSRKGSVVDANQIAPPSKDGGKVRFAGFVAVEVRGRQVLIKAPVWTLA